MILPVIRLRKAKDEWGLNEVKIVYESEIEKGAGFRVFTSNPNIFIDDEDLTILKAIENTDNCVTLTILVRKLLDRGWLIVY